MRIDSKQKRRNVFICHAWDDYAVASSVAAALQGAGLQVWQRPKQLRPGSQWAEQIEEGIFSADILLVLVSRSMLQSGWAKRELSSPSFTSALEDRAIIVIAVLLEDCELPPALVGCVLLDIRGDREKAIRHLALQLKAAPRVELALLASIDLERLVADLLVALGLHDVRPVAPDRKAGYDIEAIVEENNPFSPVFIRRWLIEVKHVTDERITIGLLKRLVDTVNSEPPSTGIVLITSARLTSIARDFVGSERIRLGREVRVVEGPQLTALVLSEPNLTAKYFPEPER